MDRWLEVGEKALCDILRTRLGAYRGVGERDRGGGRLKKYTGRKNAIQSKGPSLKCLEIAE